MIGDPLYETDSALRISDHPGRTTRGGARYVSQKTGESVFWVYVGDDAEDADAQVASTDDPTTKARRIAAAFIRFAQGK